MWADTNILFAKELASVKVGSQSVKFATSDHSFTHMIYFLEQIFKKICRW